MGYLGNIEVTGGKTNPTLDCEDSDFIIPFYKDDDYFFVLQNFVDFVKSVEALVRKHPDYTEYIGILRSYGLTKCQVMSNIDTEDESFEKTKIEMHHGPILTLFDIVAIVTEWAIQEQKKITTFYIADLVLQEHYDHTVQVVMLSKTVHEQVHQNNVWINVNQAFGRLDVFLERYRSGLTTRHIQKINDYLNKSIEKDSYHNGCLRINDQVRSWNKEFGEEL